MQPRSRRLLILGGLALSVTLGAQQVPAAAGHFDGRVTEWAAHASDCPMHRAELAKSRGTGTDSARGPGLLLTAGPTAAYAP